MNAPAEPPPLLHWLVVNRHWPEAVARAFTHPEEIGIRHEGLTALHLACMVGAAPPGVIRSLVEASPGGYAATEYLCDRGRIPLHVACVSCRPDYVSIPLEANGSTATMMTSNHYHCVGPMDIALLFFTTSWRTEVPPSLEMSDEEISDKLDNAWRVVRVLVEHQARREATGPTSRLRRGGTFLHTCVGIARCHSRVFLIAFNRDRHSFEISARARDADGQLPLHVAISNVNLCGERAAGTIGFLLLVHPAAAREVDAQSGRLPLHVAIAHGKGWAEGVESIVDAYPPAITVRDPATGMYPFMMAAAAVDGPFGRRRLIFSPEDDNADTVREHADTVHGLLRACPELQRFRHPGDEESVLDESGEGGNGVLEME